MKKSFYKVIPAIAVMVLTVAGCEKEMDDLNTTKDESTQLLNNKEYLSVIDGLKFDAVIDHGDGVVEKTLSAEEESKLVALEGFNENEWIGMTPLNLDSGDEDNKTPLKGSTTSKKKLTKKDVYNMGYSNRDIYNFSKSYSQQNYTADGFNINGEHVGRGTGSVNLAEEFGWWSYAHLKAGSKKTIKNHLSGWKEVNGTGRFVENRSKKGKTWNPGNNSYSVWNTTTANWHVSTTAGVRWNNKISFGIAESSLEVSLDVTAGGGGSKEFKQVHTYAPDAFWMKPKSEYRIVLKKKTKAIEVRHTKPV
ncbi:MAG: hypothetical protein MI922_23115, partial [Bacteroidales bacterium]|nr:hypothetical protein [Bacteroidales bacterium]